MSFDIIRDKQYFQVYKRDMRRQKLRRIVHGLQACFEKSFKVPQWKARSSQLATNPNRLRLSTCIITMNSANRIRPLLEYIRSFSDEIVVGVDSKTTDNTFEVCQGLADELFIIESTALTCNAGLEELVSHCHGDWVLRLDDDEFPEPLLHEILPALLSEANEKDITHYKMPRLHLSNVAPFEWVDDGYLYPDYQLRLFVNKPDLLIFPGPVGHKGIECHGSRSKLHSVNLVHLNLAINPRFRREEKLKTYIKRLNGEWVHPVNETALLFEDFHYKIRPYKADNTAFLHQMEETVKNQYAVYEAVYKKNHSNTDF
jgi:glycosyltransferase involved in cell wall biosynthesis